MSHKIDWATLRDELVSTNVIATPGKALDDYKTQGVFMLNYKPSDTPATDWSVQVGILLVFYAWYQGVGDGQTAYFWQFYCITNGTVHRIYARHCSHRSDGTFAMGTWTLIGP